MIAALLAGLALGGVYALAASGIVMSYISSGILNFAFAAEAYFIARLYYYLHIQQGWGIAPAAVLSVLVVAPVLGVVLWAVLFRFLRLASSLIKIEYRLDRRSARVPDVGVLRRVQGRLV